MNENFEDLDLERIMSQELPHFELGDKVVDYEGNEGEVVALNDEHSMHPDTIRVKFNGAKIAHICRTDQVRKKN